MKAPWKLAAGDTTVDLGRLLGFKITKGTGQTWTLYGLTDARDIVLLTGPEADVRKAYNDMSARVVAPGADTRMAADEP